MKRLTKIIALSMVLFVGCAFTLPATMGTLESHAASKVKISKAKATVIKGKSTTLKVKGTKKKAKWSSSKKSVATVSKKGKVTAKKAGKATITAKIGKKKYRCKVTVKNPTTSLSKTSLKLNIGSKYTLRATSNGVSKKVKWKSSNAAVASVTSKGVVTAKKAGTARVTAIMNGVAKSCSIKVIDPAGSRTNPANIRNGITVKNTDGTFYAKLDRTLRSDMAINQLKAMGEWDEYSLDDVEENPGTQVAYFEYTIKALSGFNRYPLEGLDIINSYGLYNPKCVYNLPDIEPTYMHNRYENKDVISIKLYSGGSSKMYMVLLVPDNITSFTYPIMKNDYSYFWTKYTF